MSRLLFAAARGARLQFRCPGLIKFVNDSVAECMWFAEQGHDVRIHPGDENLQYGPISTELRRYVEQGGWSHSDIGRVAQALLREWAPYPPVLASDWPHFQMLALLLAEALADEGL